MPSLPPRMLTVHRRREELAVEPGAADRPVPLPQPQLDELPAELQGRLQAVMATRDRMRGLLEAVVAIGSGLDLESIWSGASRATADKRPVRPGSQARGWPHAGRRAPGDARPG
jgi:hypothetical protein